MRTCIVDVLVCSILATMLLSIAACSTPQRDNTDWAGIAKHIGKEYK